MIEKTIVAVIPARYESSRFPGKPLVKILGKTMIDRVYHQVKKVDIFSEVVVATDDNRIFNEVKSFGGNVLMTGKCSCGTERVYEVVKDMDVDVIINIQGDEPLIKPEMIKELVDTFNDDSVQMATLKKKIIREDEVLASNVVKVITDIHEDAIYFSRNAIPFNRNNEMVDYYKHIGIYGYTKDFLKTYVEMPESKLESIEKLEQLRVLENGYKLRVKETTYDSLGVDLPEQVALVEEMLKNEQ